MSDAQAVPAPASPAADGTAPAAPHAVLMAAGKGTRMNSDLPKVLHPVAGRPMLAWVADACFAAGVERCVVVVGYGADRVRAAMAHEPRCVFVEQTEQLGTAHAVEQARPAFENVGDTEVFVLAGDGPLIRPDTLRRLRQVHRDAGAAATLATARLDNPDGYGRVLRDADGGFDRIVEQKDATDDQRAVNEVNPSYYCFGREALFDALTRVNNDNAQGEYYITDVPAVLKRDGRTVAVVDAVPAEDVLSVNTPEQLAAVEAVLRERAAATPETDQPR